MASPPIGALDTVRESWRRANDVARDGRAKRSLPALRGLALVTPLLIVLWYLFAQADPHMSAWGTAIAKAIEDLAFVPRLVFGAGIFVLVLGAYGLASRGEARAAAGVRPPQIALAATERTIIVGGVVLLLSLFLALQLPYLFGNPAGTTGSGITYAEWAHRGFAELSVAATIITVLILLLHVHAARGSAREERLIGALSLALVAFTALVVLSAFRRITLYESAYGYTVARLEAQAFMLGVGIALALLAGEIRGGVDPRRFARRTAVIAAAMVAALIYWNDDAFIVRRNVAAFAGTPKLDIVYLATRLGPDALPALVAATSTLPGEQGTRLATCLAWRYSKLPQLQGDELYELNLRRSAAAAAMERLSGDIAPATAKGCMGWKD